MVQVLGKLRQLTSAVERSRLDHERSILLGVTLAVMQVEHVGDDRPLQASPRPRQYIESRAGDLDPTLKIDDAKGGSQFPMDLRLKVEFR